MTPYNFADRHLGEYKVKGDEIVPTLCPYCHGGTNRDKYTFALNADKLTYNCKRGSCNVSGTFNQLKRDFGELEQRNFEIRPRPKKKYVKPAAPTAPATSQAEEYLKKRGFSKETWEARGVCSDSKGNIAMPYYENGELVMMKYRPAHKVKQGERKGWREKDGKPVFWGMDNCDPSKPLFIVEGEMDALALDECSVPNVVSVPNGANDLTCVDLCWDWLQKFNRIVLWVDNDEPGQALQRELINKLGAWRCSVVVSERKDANEVLLFDGIEAVIKALRSVKEVPIDGLTRMADIQPFSYENSVRIKSNVETIDKHMGGFMLGQVSVWTGVNSSGKSTFLGQLMLEAIDQGYKVCAYSGELPAHIFKYWIDLQAAGPQRLEKRYDKIKQTDIYFPTKQAREKITEWYRHKFFLYDCFYAAKDSKLLEVFEYAARRYDCKVFLIDNLMTTVFGRGTEKDFYRAQSEFVGEVIKFAQQFNVHIHLVAHPRKTEGKLTKMDVAGTGDITNRADNVFSVERLTEEEQAEMGYDNQVNILKDRLNGTQNKAVGLMFNDRCKRFYMKKQGIRRFGWDIPTVEEAKELFGDA